MAKGKTIEDFLTQYFHKGMVYDIDAEKKGKTIYSILVKTQEYRKNSLMNLWHRNSENKNGNKKTIMTDEKGSKTV